MATYSDDLMLANDYNSAFLNEQLLDEKFTTIQFGDEMTADDCSTPARHFVAKEWIVMNQYQLLQTI